MKRPQNKCFVGDRLKQYLNENNISIYRLEHACGLSNGYFRNVGFNLPVDKIDLICKVLPRLNRKWLITGKGEMINSNVEVFAVEEPIAFVDETPKSPPQPVIDNTVKDYQVEIHFEGVFKADVRAISENEAVLSVKQAAYKMPLGKLAKQIGLHDTDIKILLKS